CSPLFRLLLFPTRRSSDLPTALVEFGSEPIPQTGHEVLGEILDGRLPVSILHEAEDVDGQFIIGMADRVMPGRRDHIMPGRTPSARLLAGEFADLDEALALQRIQMTTDRRRGQVEGFGQ